MVTKTKHRIEESDRVKVTYTYLEGPCKSDVNNDCVIRAIDSEGSRHEIQYSFETKLDTWMIPAILKDVGIKEHEKQQTEQYVKSLIEGAREDDCKYTVGEIEPYIYGFLAGTKAVIKKGTCSNDAIFQTKMINHLLDEEIGLAEDGDPDKIKARNATAEYMCKWAEVMEKEFRNDPIKVKEILDLAGYYFEGYLAALTGEITVR